MSAPRCPVKFNGGDPCGEIMRPVTDAIGKLAFVCDKCARFAKGICRDCPRARVGHSPRCADCRTARRKSHDSTSYTRRGDQQKAHKRHRYHTDPDYRRRRLEDMRRRARAIGRTDQVRAYERAMAAKYRAQKRAANQRTAA